MQTVVYQSYRTTNVPEWISRCMESVRVWASAKGYGYRFIDDSFFEAAPDWLRAKSPGSILPVTDICRLVWARKLLDEGADRVVWCDADMLIFDIENFSIKENLPYSFCREIAVHPAPDGVLAIDRRVNNSVTMFQKGNSFLAYYLDTALTIARNSPGQLDRLSMSTTFLSRLSQLAPMPMLTTVGCFAGNIIVDLAQKNDRWPRAHYTACGGPVYAANLCHSFSTSSVNQAGGKIPDSLFALAVDQLVETRGAVVNSF